MYAEVVRSIAVLFAVRLNVDGERDIVADIMVRIRCIIVHIKLTLAVIMKRICDDFGCRVVFRDMTSGAVDDVSAEFKTEGFGCRSLLVTIHERVLLRKDVCRVAGIYSGDPESHGV